MLRWVNEELRRRLEDLPVLYGWSDIQHEGLRSTIKLDVPGGMQLDTPYYFARSEKLQNIHQ